MPIRWNSLKVSEAADRIEEQVNLATPYLEQAQTIARESLSIPHLPQYVDQHFRGLWGEIDRAIGGSQFEPVGRLKARLESIRKSIPSGALGEEREKTKNGSQQALI